MIAYRCPGCQRATDSKAWRKCEVECESCGYHSAIECPRCRHAIDLVRTEIEEEYDIDPLADELSVSFDTQKLVDT